MCRNDMGGIRDRAGRLRENMSLVFHTSVMFVLYKWNCTEHADEMRLEEEF